MGRRRACRYTLAQRGPSHRQWVATYQRLAASPGAAVAVMQMNKEIDVRPILPAIRTPTLVLHRTGDGVTRVEQARYLAEHIPGARLVELAGADHTPWVGDIDLIVDEVEEFLTGAYTPPSPTASSPRCSSRTSWAPRKGPPLWATGSGATCSARTTWSREESWSGSAATRWIRRRRLLCHIRRAGSRHPVCGGHRGWREGPRARHSRWPPHWRMRGHG